MDLQQAALAAVERVFSSDAITQAIEKSIAKTVEDAIKDQLGAYSDFGKELKKKVGEALKLHGDIDLPSYNDSLLKIVRQSVEGRVNATIQQQVTEQLEGLLETAPESIKFSALVEEFKEWAKDQARSCSCDGEGEVSVLLDESETVTGYRSIFFDAERDQRDYLTKTKRRDKWAHSIILNTDKEGRVYGLRLSGEDVTKTIFVGPLYGFERRLFQLFSAKTRIEFDARPEELDLSLSSYEDS